MSKTSSLPGLSAKILRHRRMMPVPLVAPDRQHLLARYTIALAGAPPETTRWRGCRAASAKASQRSLFLVFRMKRASGTVASIVLNSVLASRCTASEQMVQIAVDVEPRKALEHISLQRQVREHRLGNGPVHATGASGRRNRPDARQEGMKRPWFHIC